MQDEIKAQIEVINDLYAHGLEAGQARKKDQICGFLRSLIVSFEKKDQEVTWDVANTNLDKEEALKRLHQNGVCLALLRSTLSTIVELY